MAEMRTEHALAIVRGQLRRAPTDALEAAVVLESTAGLAPERALELGRKVARAARMTSRESGRLPVAIARLVDVADDTVRARLVALLAFIALLAALGPSTVSAWRAAMVVGFALQGLLFRRYLTGQDRLGIVRRYPLGAFVSVLAAAALATVLAHGHALAAALLTIWIGGIVVAERGWTIAFTSLAAIVVLARVSGLLHDSAEITFAECLAMSITGVLVLAALATTTPSTLRPCSWLRAGFSALTAAGFGLMIWLLPENWAFDTVRSAGPHKYALYYAAIPLLMALVGATWAASHLNELWHAVPRVFSHTELGPNAADTARSVAYDVLLGAAVRLAAAWLIALLIILSLSLSPGFRPELRNALELLVVLFAITSLAVETTLLDTFEQAAAALFAVLVAVATTLALLPLGSRSVVTAVGTLVGFVIASTLLARQLRRSPLTFVTPLR